jgi:hypothetical protein
MLFVEVTFVGSTIAVWFSPMSLTDIADMHLQYIDLNAQLIFDPKAGSATKPIRRYSLGRLLGATGLFISDLGAQEPGCITDDPLLAIGFTSVQVARRTRDLYRNIPR